MDRVLQPATDKFNFKICGTCRKAMDINSSFKTCEPCLAKHRAQRERARLKMKEMQHMMVQANMGLNHKYNATVALSKDGQENAAYHDGSRKLSVGVKRKPEKSLSELEGEERKVALKMARKSLTEIIRRQAKKPMPAANVKSVSDLFFV